MQLQEPNRHKINTKILSGGFFYNHFKSKEDRLLFNAK